MSSIKQKFTVGGVSPGSGDVTGPASATGDNIALFDGATGKTIKDSGVALSAKANTSHTHTIGDTTGLQTALDGKAASSHTHAIGDTTGLQTVLDGKAASSHTHAIADVTNLQTSLNAKAASTHSHAISDVTGLQTALNAKQDSGSYAPATSGTSILKGNGSGGFSNAIAGTDYSRPYTLVATLANDATTGANVTPISLTGLVWDFEANSIYMFYWIGSVNAAANTTGCGFQLDVSAAVTNINMTFFHQLANTGTISGGSSIADDASAGVSSGIPANSTNVPVSGQGMLKTGANTGTAQLRFRSETTAAITAKAGMTLVVEKVA